LVRVTQKATDWVNRHPEEAAAIMARQFSINMEKVLPIKEDKTIAKFEITPEVLMRSMSRLEYTTSVNSEMVQEVIDYMTRLGYIRKSFKANDMLDSSFLR
jgi:NitT/TauT family transport system substrate-binding protein